MPNLEFLDSRGDMVVDNNSSAEALWFRANAEDPCRHEVSTSNPKARRQFRERLPIARLAGLGQSQTRYRARAQGERPFLSMLRQPRLQHRLLLRPQRLLQWLRRFLGDLRRFRKSCLWAAPVSES